MPTTTAQVPPAGTTPAKGSWRRGAGGGAGGSTGASKWSGGGVMARSPAGGPAGASAPASPERLATAGSRAACAPGQEGRGAPGPRTRAAPSPTTAATTPVLMPGLPTCPSTVGRPARTAPAPPERARLARPGIRRPWLGFLPRRARYAGPAPTVAGDGAADDGRAGHGPGPG